MRYDGLWSVQRFRRVSSTAVGSTARGSISAQTGKTSRFAAERPPCTCGCVYTRQHLLTVCSDEDKLYTLASDRRTAVQSEPFTCARKFSSMYTCYPDHGRTWVGSMSPTPRCFLQLLFACVLGGCLW